MTYEEFKAMMTRFFEEHPIKIKMDRFHTEESLIWDGGEITIDLSAWFDN